MITPWMNPSLSGIFCIFILAIQHTMMGKSQSLGIKTETGRLPPKKCTLEKIQLLRDNSRGYSK